MSIFAIFETTSVTFLLWTLDQDRHGEMQSAPFLLFLRKYNETHFPSTRILASDPIAPLSYIPRACMRSRHDAFMQWHGGVDSAGKFQSAGGWRGSRPRKRPTIINHLIAWGLNTYLVHGFHLFRRWTHKRVSSKEDTELVRIA